MIWPEQSLAHHPGLLAQNILTFLQKLCLCHCPLIVKYCSNIGLPEKSNKENEKKIWYLNGFCDKDEVLHKSFVNKCSSIWAKILILRTQFFEVIVCSIKFIPLYSNFELQRFKKFIFVFLSFPHSSSLLLANSLSTFLKVNLLGFDTCLNWWWFD